MEIEAKFSISGEQTFRRLLEATALAGFGLGDASVMDLHDRYLDTADWAIRDQGYAYRLRYSGDRYLATLKGLGGAVGAIHRRPEYQVELTGPLSPRDWPPSSARDLALRLCENKPLVGLFEIEQVRHSRLLYDRGCAVAEFSLDRVMVRHGESRQPMDGYMELEAELLPDGNEGNLEKLVIELEDVWGLRPESRSKYERGLETLRQAQVTPDPLGGRGMEEHLTARHKQSLMIVEELPMPAAGVELLENPGIRPDDPMSEAGRKTFRFHYRRMLHNEPGTRLGEDIDALHDMRVATRRMRAAFRVFGAYYEPKAVAPHLKGLKRTGRALGAVRDLDVFRLKIQTHVGSLPEWQQDSLGEFLAVLEGQRGAARERLLDYLEGKKYRRFVERFGEFVETEGLGGLPPLLEGDEPRPYRVRHVAPVAIYGRLASVRAYDEWVTIPDPPLARLHALRIACKGLRYSLEFFREVLGQDTKALIREVVVMQDHLGELQDAVVARSILGDYLRLGMWGQAEDQPPLDLGSVGSDPGVEAYLASKELELQHLVDTFPQAWQRLQSNDFSRVVAEAVVVL